uniref:Coiled-coil alpha-helical rod protein 1 n=1 Tax=Gouania willdenowi TaxID=441366 RepID=A0A8C5HT12_GOUWI
MTEGSGGWAFKGRAFSFYHFALLFQLQQLNASHCAELDAARRTNAELESRLQSVTSEVLQLRSSMMEASAEKDGLKEHLRCHIKSKTQESRTLFLLCGHNYRFLRFDFVCCFFCSQMGQAFQTQSETLQSLRNYIGQFTPEKGEKEQLNEAIEKLKKEKVSLQTTAELLTVRLNSVNEILALQEEKLNMKQASTYLLNKNGCEAVHMLQLWREKVFKLCSFWLLSHRLLKQQLEQEHQRAAVLQHSLQDKTAELDLERVEKEVNILLAKARLNTFTQRLTFAQRRVETIQGMDELETLDFLLTAVKTIKIITLGLCYRVAPEEGGTTESRASLQTEHKLVCEERDRLTQELKRTPELIEKALTDLKLQCEMLQMPHLCCYTFSRQEAEQSLQQTRAQLEESEVSLEKLRCELLRLVSFCFPSALQDRVSEIEERCAEKLREMEVQVDMARRGHTKAVVTLRQFEREAARKRDAMTELQSVERMSFKKKDLKTLPKEAGRDANLTLVRPFHLQCSCNHFSPCSQ